MDEPGGVQAKSADNAVLARQGDVDKHGFYPHVVEDFVEEKHQTHFRRRLDPIV